MRVSKRSLIGVSLCLALACDDPPMESLHEGTIAVYEGGVLTAAEVDAALLEFDPARRPPPGEGLADWYRTFVHELALDRVLLAQSALDELRKSPEWASREDDARRRAFLRIFLERLPPVAPPTEEEIRNEFDASPEAQFRSASRRVFHIFLRTGEDRSAEQAKGELEAIRRRVLAGESFSRLAGELSDSETRHKGGEMGWLRAEQLGTLGPRVFALEPEVPSEPVMTPQGGHLFFVDGVNEARKFELADVEQLIAAKLVQERVRNELEEAVAQLPPVPEPYFVPDATELQSLLAGGQADTVVLQLGAFSLDLRGLRELLAAAGDAGGGLEGVTGVLARLENRERVYQHGLSEDWSSDPEVAQRVEAELEHEALRFYRERKLVERVAASRPEVEAYYEARRRRFTKPLRLALRELRVPITAESANEVMRRLEAFVPLISQGEASLESPQEELGGEIRDVGWVTLAQLASVAPATAAQAAALEGAGCLPPFRRQQSLHLMEVTDREEPAERPFAEVVPEVERAYLQENRVELYEQMRGDLLASAGFRLVVDDVEAAVRQAGLAD